MNYKWNLIEYDEETDEVRPEFAQAAPKKKFNPVTMKMEPYLPKKDRFKRFMVSWTSLVFWVCMKLIIKIEGERCSVILTKTNPIPYGV